MWGFVDCTRYFRSVDGPRVVLDEANMVVGTRDKVALFVPTGQGKSTIVKLLAGLDLPDEGIVLRDEGGWPIGYGGSINQTMSGEANVRNLAELADVDPDQLSSFVYDFSELGDAYFHPVKLYSNSMKARLSFASSFGVPARTYLADDKIAAGEESFRRKCVDAMAERLETAGLILVSSAPKIAADICDQFYVLSDGKILRCDDFEDAQARFRGAQETAAADDPESDALTFDLV